MPKVKDRSGKVYGKLTVLRRTINDRHGNARWRCVCECGNQLAVGGPSLEKGETKSCGCYKSNLQPFESLYNRLKQQEYRYPVGLSFKEFLEFTKQNFCHYCKIPIIWRPHYAGRGGYQLDRMDNSQGYTKDNCVVCCKRCNRAKGKHFTYDEWKSIGRLIQAWEK